MTIVGKKPKKKQYIYRKRTLRDEVRQIFRENGMLEYLAPLRRSQTRLERALTARRIDTRLASVLSSDEALDLAADLTRYGIQPGRTSFTRPERLVIGYLLHHGYQYGGEGYQFNPNSDFGSQVPVNGGKYSDKGTVVDVFLTSKVVANPKGTLLFVDGNFIHSRNSVATRDKQQEQMLTAQGWVIERIMDYETDLPGILDKRMSAMLLPR